MLTWNAEKVENFKAKTKKHPGRFECFLKAAFEIGLNEIKENNVKEWTYRINRMKFEGYSLFVKYVSRNGKITRKELDMTEADVSEWIGLKTNVSQISNAAFDKMMRELTGR